MQALALRIGLSVAIIACWLGGCANGPLRFDSPELNAQYPAIRDGVLKADAVFVGRIVRVGPPPSVESGRSIAFQEVVYEILAVLKGNLDGGDITVRHLVRPGDAFSAQLIQGRELVVFARQRGDDYWAAGSVAGAVPASKENVDAVKDILKEGLWSEPERNDAGHRSGVMDEVTDR